MNCFEHQETTAVGVCNICSRAVCPECSEVVDKILTCGADYCADRVMTHKFVIDRNARIQEGMGAHFNVAIIFQLAIGAAIFTWAAMLSNQHGIEMEFAFLALMGLVLIGLGLFNVVRRKKIIREDD